MPLYWFKSLYSYLSICLFPHSSIGILLAQINLRVKTVSQSIQCTVYFLSSFVFKLLVLCSTGNLCHILQALLFCFYNICRRNRALCMSKNRWVKHSETFSIALLCVVNSIIKVCFYLFIKLWGKENYTGFDYVVGKLCCSLVRFPESNLVH